MKEVISILAIVLLSAWANPLLERKVITGHVYDHTSGNPLGGVLVEAGGAAVSVRSGNDGFYSIEVPAGTGILRFSLEGYHPQKVNPGAAATVDVYLRQAPTDLPVESEEMRIKKGRYAKYMMPAATGHMADHSMMGGGAVYEQEAEPFNTEEYSAIHENIFHRPLNKPLSTFSIDVDAASYSNIRRFINGSQLPPKDAVRIEEMINYFTYDYRQPAGDDPFSINTEAGECPWNKDHYLVHIGLQGRIIPTENLPASNLVFLIDVSGSMGQSNKLPLLKSAFKLLVDELRPQDKVSIVVYAGAAGVVLPPTAGDKKQAIIASLENLQAGGSTAGGQGIKLAYAIARQHLIKGGNNRVILATDGDFNVGASSNAEMERLIEQERESGVFLTVLGFGMGNYKDSKMEVLADKGNGNYAYIDNILEAKKVFVNEFGGTLFTIAKDVKIQVEFNPSFVQAYRLVGYENRKLKDEDFNNDKKDAGELGSGHTVTALYEIIPVGVSSDLSGTVDPLKYQKQEPGKSTQFRDEMMTVKLRYKLPDEDASQLITRIIDHQAEAFDETSENYRFSAAVAAFGMILRDSEFKGTADYDQVLAWARHAKGKDSEGYRAEFIKLVETAGLLGRS